MEEYNIFPHGFHSCDCRQVLDVQAVLNEFKEHGFDVTEEAILHNFEAWKADYKSGYRDDNNDVFLFTPCGCNPLRFNAMHLQEKCDWQKTYIC